MSSQKSLAAAVVVALLSLGGPAAAATPVPAPPPSVPTAGVHLVAGLGTPYGLTGLEFEFLPVRWVSLAGGGGLGLGGPQAAAMVRGRWRAGSGVTWSLGAGPSRGRYRWRETCIPDFEQQCEGEKAGTVWWTNLELGFELAPPPAGSGALPIIVRGFVGAAIPGNPSAVRCVPNRPGHCEEGASPLFFMGASFGLALPLVR